MTIRFPKYDEYDDILPGKVDASPDQVDLPPRHVIDAGIAKFAELARLHWPAKDGGFHLTGFDFNNKSQIRMTLGLVYMAMVEAAGEK